jgi:hypothetical protein
MASLIVSGFFEALRTVGQFEPEPRPCRVRGEAAAARVGHAVEQATLDSGVIGEVFEVTGVGDGAAHVAVRNMHRSRVEAGVLHDDGNVALDDRGVARRCGHRFGID